MGNNEKHTFNYQVMKNGSWHVKDIIKNDGKQMRSVWSISTPSKKEKVFGKHPTQKPLQLLERIILSSTMCWKTVGSSNKSVPIIQTLLIVKSKSYKYPVKTEPLVGNLSLKKSLMFVKTSLDSVESVRLEVLIR